MVPSLGAGRQSQGRLRVQLGFIPTITGGSPPMWSFLGTEECFRRSCGNIPPPYLPPRPGAVEIEGTGKSTGIQVGQEGADGSLTHRCGFQGKKASRSHQAVKPPRARESVLAAFLGSIISGVRAMVRWRIPRHRCLSHLPRPTLDLTLEAKFIPAAGIQQNGASQFGETYKGPE